MKQKKVAVQTDVGEATGQGNGKWIHAGTLTELRKKGCLLIRGSDRPVAVFWSEGQVRAVDNRCPHMGFPMNQGTVKDGVITCHWHHARFDLQGGCAFDLFADDLPSFAVRIEGDLVFVAPEPREKTGPAFFRKRLRYGLQQGIGLIQAKSIVGLIHEGEGYSSIACEVARFAQEYAEDWGDGLTFLTITGNLWAVLEPETRVYALAQATRRVAANTAGRPGRRRRDALDNGPGEADQLRRWMKNWVLTRHRDGLERTLLTAFAAGVPRVAILDILVEALGCRVYVQGGHTLDAANKAYEFLSSIGDGMASDLFSLLVPDLAMGRGEEESSAWRNPCDLVQLIREMEPKVPDSYGDADTGPPDLDEWTDLIWNRPPETIFDTMLRLLNEGMAPWRMAQAIAAAAATRLARFAATNDIGDWFGPAHAFIFANAVCRVLQRKVSMGAVMQLFHAAGAVYIDRFVNVPAARLPSEGRNLEGLSDGHEILCKMMLSSLDHHANIDGLPALVVRYLQLGHDRNRLMDTLVYATVREDLDFHKLQVWEAAWQQARLWDDEHAIEVLYAGAARHLAAHCPTRRSEAQMTRIALRLHRGDSIHEDTGSVP